MNFFESVGFIVNIVITVLFALIALLYRNKCHQLYIISAACFGISVVGSVFASLFFYADGAWKWWLLFSAMSDFGKYFVIQQVSKKSNPFPTITLLLKVTLTLNIVGCLLEHIDYALLGTGLFYSEYSTITKTINSLFLLTLMAPLTRYYVKSFRPLARKW